MRVAWTATLIALVLLGGCLGPADEASQEDLETESQPLDSSEITWHEEALVSGDDHDHNDPAQHENLTTPNFETIGHDPLTSERFGHSPGGSACASVDGENETRLGAQKAGNNRGAVITDLTDPTAPEYLGEFYLTGTYVYDVAVVPDGEHIAFITTYHQAPHDDETPDQPPAPSSSESSVTVEWTSPCTDEALDLTEETQDPAPRPMSILLIDVSDPSNPQIADQRPISGLGHSIHSTETEDRTWLLGVTDSLTLNTRHFHFYEVTNLPGADATLQPLSVYNARSSPDHADFIGGHSDGWIQEHPITGQTLAYLAAGPAFEIVDVSNPHAPEPIGWWSDIGADSPGDHLMHSVTALDETRDGRHYAILGPEASSKPSSGPSGVVWVLDTTDPSQPEAVAGWTLPADVEWQGRLQFSNHYMDVLGDTLFVSVYHGGIWAVDLNGLENGTEDDPSLLDSIGVYAPTSDETTHPRQGWRPWTPTLQDVYAIDDEALVTFGANSGVWVFTFDEASPAPTPEPWPIDPPPDVQEPPLPR